jgi:acetoin utilization protein AcuB
MFAVYNEQGRTFRSTLEDLYLVQGIKPAKRLKPVARDTGDEQQPASQSYYTKEAIKAYKEVIQAKHEEVIYHAYQIMKRPVITVLDTTPITDCYMLLQEKGVRQLPVMNVQNSPVGLISKEKILEKLIIEDNVIQEAKAASVRELMDYPIITADPLADIRRVAKIMFDHDLNCIPITNEADMFVGIITRTDYIYAVSTFPGLTLRA